MTNSAKAIPYETVVQDCLACYNVLVNSSNYFNIRTIKKRAGRAGHEIPHGRGARCIKVLENAGLLYRDDRSQNNFFSIKKKVSEEELMVIIKRGFLEPAISWSKEGNAHKSEGNLPLAIRDNLEIFLREGYLLKEERWYIVNSKKISKLEEECKQYLTAAEDLLKDQEEISIEG